VCLRDRRIRTIGARVVAQAALLAVIASMIAGCASGAGEVSGAVVPVARAPQSVHCGEAAVLGRSLPMAQSRMLGLPGSPDGIATTRDGRLSFVALQTGVPRIAVIENDPSGERLLRTIVVPAYASGMNVTPDGRYALGAAGRGALVLDIAAARSGVGRVLLGWLAAPAGVAGAGPGAAEIAVSRDARYVFVTLEGAGAVAVFDLDAASSHAFRGGFLGAVPVGAGALGITVSPDGDSLYEVSEAGIGGPAHQRGLLNVLNLRRAVSDPERSVIATATAACAPVRVAVSPDGVTVWVTARDANALLGFSAVALRRDPTHARVSVTRVGARPLGLALANGGRIVLVADSNGSQQTRSRLSVVQVAAGEPRLLGWVAAGELADAVSATGALALVTNSKSNQLQALAARSLP
jgi:DNA-binding beta-propeller fold protein YncE